MSEFRHYVDSLYGTAIPNGFSTWKAALVTFSVAYLLLCRLLRFKRMRSMHQRFSYPSRDSLTAMTNEDAQKIQLYLAELEFPVMFSISLGFALFKTYGIPTISSLLVATGQSSNPYKISKRTTDTAAILCEIALNSPTSDRAMDAVVRMNYLHSRYRQQGKISNDDLLYTLSMFALEPARWIDKYEWRRCSDMERCAMGVFWKTLGDAMEISWEPLLSHDSGWRDGLEWLSELETWSQEYEQKNMKAAPTNHKISKSTVDFRLESLRPLLWKSTTNLISTLLDDRLRDAIMFEKPSNGYFIFSRSVTTSRKFWLRYLALPRPDRRRRKVLAKDPDPYTGHYQFVKNANKSAYPWYAKVLPRSKWSLKYWFGKSELKNGSEGLYQPEGYLIQQLGPEHLRHNGVDYMARNRETLHNKTLGGCPFTP